jgi:raffinose/stachyose/melibiose transport system permease protein
MGLFRYTWKTFAREMMLLAGAVVFCVPLYLLVVFPLKTPQDAYTKPTSLPTNPTFANFRQAWQGSGGVTLGSAMVNSLIITVGSVICLLVLGSIAAYVLARRPSKLSTGLYVLYVLGFIIPFQLAIVPLYVAMRHLHLIGSYLGMILLYTGLFMPLTVFLYTGFIRVLPREYEESAQVDGAGMWRTYLRVVFPLLRPVTGTVAVLAGIIIWNDFFGPLIFLSGTNKATLPVAIYSFVGDFTAQWNLIFAAVVISILPVFAFYLVAQRQLIKGFTGGIRG